MDVVEKLHCSLENLNIKWLIPNFALTSNIKLMFWDD